MWLSQCIILYKRELDLDILALGTHQGQIIYYQMNGDCEMEGGDWSFLFIFEKGGFLLVV